jgi:hypothetical protein
MTALINRSSKLYDAGPLPFPSCVPWCSEFRFWVIYFSSLAPLREQSAARGPACGRGISLLSKRQLLEKGCRSSTDSALTLALPEVPALVFCIGQDMRFHWYPSLSRTGGVKRQRSWLDLVGWTISDLYNLAISVPLNPAFWGISYRAGAPTPLLY